MMRKSLALLLLLFPFAVTAQEIVSDPTFEYSAPAADSGELLVDFENDEAFSRINEILSILGLDNSEYSWLSREEKWLKVFNFATFSNNFQRYNEVDAVEPNYYATALYVPNDPYYKHQWHLDIIGMKEAWDFPRGSDVIVAVIDTGVAFEKHGSRFRVEDLGETQFAKPHNFISGDEHASDDHGHGTHVAGTIAQLTNNKVGVAGVAPNVKIMPLKVLNSRGFGTYGDIAAAIRYAADNGAKVINMSLGGPFPSFVLHKAIKYAKEKGVTIVCAAGNSGRSGLSYPAKYSECISVSAVRFDRTLSWYSSYGKGLTIAAPGGDMNVDQNGDGLMDGVLQNTLNPQDPTKQGYFLFQGTSMATPHVAAAAALLVSHGIQDPDKVREYLESSATKVQGGSSEKYGAGVLNVNAALRSAFSFRKVKIFSVALLLFLLLIALINRGRSSTEKVRLGFGSVLGLLLGATGLFFLGKWLPSFLSTSILEWPAFFGAGANPLFWSVLPVLLISLIAYPWKRSIGLAVGFASGAAAFLIVQAASPVAGLSWIPGSILEAAWLLFNGLLCLAVASITSFRLR
ncbi:S8 family peptidase [bacterium]|nr:S8 family peptidase [bacterium]